MNNRIYILLTSLIGASAVVLGAFGAHALAPHLNESQIQNFKTASMYHYIHVVVLLGLSLFNLLKSDRVIRQSFVLFTLGILFFSGSLYLLSTRHLLGGDFWLFLGPVTPLGGLFLILGWINLLRLRP